MDPNAQQTAPAPTPAPAAAPAPSAAPEAEAPLVAGDSVKDRAFREAIEAFEAEDAAGGEPDPTAPAVEEPTPTTDEPPADTGQAAAAPADLGPSDDEVAELERLAEKRRQDLATQAQRHQAEARARQEQDAFAQQQRELQRLTALAKTNPLAFLRESGVDLVDTYDKLHETAKDPATVAARSLAAKLEAQNRELLERIDRLEKGIPERERQNAEAEAQRRGERIYAEHTSDAKAYPIQARLTEAERVAYGEQAARLLRDAGKPYGAADVARLVERNLRAQVQRLTGAPSGAGGTEAASAAVSETATPSGAQAASTGRPPTRAISNQLAATTGGDGGYKNRHDFHADVLRDIASGA